MPKRGGVAADPAIGPQKGDSQPAERFAGAPGELRSPPVETDNAQHSAEIITQRHQAPFAAHLVEPAHQEVALSSAAFERAKRMFGQRLAAAHHVLAGEAHPGPVALDHLLIHPAFDLTPLALKWASGALSNNGFALVADAPAAPETWQVVWSGSSPHPSVDGVIIKPEAAPGGEASTGATSGESAGTTGDVASTPAATESAPSFGGALASPAASALSAPTAAEPAQTARLQLYRPAVVSEGKPKRAPPVGFYLAGVVLVALLLLGGVALGDRGEPALERRGSVIRTLERRKETSA